MVSSDKEQIQALAQRILVTCAHRLGGVAALAKHLGVSEATLGQWLNGKLVPPVDMVMKAAGPLLSEERSVAVAPAEPRASKPR